MIVQIFTCLSRRRIWKNNLGAVATEYAFVIAFISIVAAMGMTIMGNNLSGFYSTIGTALSDMACAMPETASQNGQDNSNKCK
jgi:Flp pilus assembly pilin Flp